MGTCPQSIRERNRKRNTRTLEARTLRLLVGRWPDPLWPSLKDAPNYHIPWRCPLYR